MANHTFATWLYNEAASGNCALLKLYEELDRLKYIEGPRLEKEYMDKIGSFEESVIKEEIECELLIKKQEMIRAALNRREPIDEEAIDKEIESLRQEMIKEASADAPPKEYADLSEEQANELQEIYRNIINRYHPQIHTGLTDAHKELFKKAQEAYRRRDVSALKLIYDMMTNADKDELFTDVLLRMLNDLDDIGINVFTDDTFTTDYSLAADLYKNFVPTADEAAISEDRLRYKKLFDEAMKEIETLKTQFPYTAAETLSDPEKISKYKLDLEHRLFEASKERARLTDEIEKMKGEAVRHG